ncbi:hypothetical protein [Nostoc sp. NMS4]|uniref:hypothetical protein n=1 Tax=Nostoc sp. NMS4 TaxID=2815390 RepID=UPI0025CF325F|nr:hypothetical protein [Nostoc sp. NMS4]MBN3925773.1 hypothetical protein [Nostoc sp. NMS4]
MFNRVTAAIITATISFSATSAFAINNRVHVIGSCAAYNNRGVRVTILRPDYYILIEERRFNDGDRGVKVWSVNDESGLWRKVNVSSRCLESHGGIITRY